MHFLKFNQACLLIVIVSFISLPTLSQNATLAMVVCDEVNQAECAALVFMSDNTIAGRSEDAVLAQSLFPDLSVRAVSDAAFAALAAMSTEGFGMVEKTRYPQRRIPGRTTHEQIAEIANRNFVTLSPQVLLKGAEDIPPQQESWTCGPNSGARACVMLGLTMGMYNYFMNHCPKSFGAPNTPEGVAMAFVSVVGLISYAFPDVGPSPSVLADYLDRHLPSYSVVHSITDDWDNQAQPLIRREIQEGRPLIALLVWSDFRMHYVNLVGYSDDSNSVIYLDTNGSFNKISCETLQYEMDAHESIIAPHVVGTYNFIQFVRTALQGDLGTTSNQI